MRTIATTEELIQLAGQEIALSAWTIISQQHIGQFADTTGDDQWIHLDSERARNESPFGGTIAHGFLTLSLVPALMNAAIGLPPARMTVNYGLNKVRFPTPVPAESRLRGRFTLGSVEKVDGGLQMTWLVAVELEGAAKPACIAELIVRQYG